MKVKVKKPNVCYIVNARQTGVLRVNKHDTAMPPSLSLHEHATDMSRR